MADILDAAPKDDLVSMEHPIFALKSGDLRVRVYERKGVRVTIKPGHDGCATTRQLPRPEGRSLRETEG